MERNYRSRTVDSPNGLGTQEHLPTQTKPKESYNPFLLLPSKFIGYFNPSSILSLFLGAKRKKPFQHQEKDLPGKLRAAIGEGIEDYCELDCQEKGRRLFRVTTKSGIIYITRVRDNLSRVINKRQVS
jgi:hypothetical protein